MSVQFCLAFLALCSLAAATDPDCADLIKPLQDQNQLSGKWIYHAGTSDNEELLTKLKTFNSSWIELSSKPDSENMTLRYADRVDGKCYTGEVDFVFSGSIINVTFPYNGTDSNHVGKYLVSCPDCVLWVDTMTMNDTTSRHLYHFTKTGKLDDSHLEVLKKQAACLNFPAELHFGGNTDLCPDEKAAATDGKK